MKISALLISLVLATACGNGLSVNRSPNDTAQPKHSEDNSKDMRTKSDSGTEARTMPHVGIVTLGADWRDDEKAIASLYSYVKKANATSTYIYSGGDWREVEKTPGKYDFAGAQPQIKAIKAYGFKASALDIPLPFFFDKPVVPADMTFVSYDDTELLTRYHAFVKAVLNEYGGPTHVVLHSEGAGSVFTSDSEEFKQFCTMVAATAKFIKEEFPGTLVSNYNTEYESAEISECLNKEMNWWADGLVLDVASDKMRATVVEKLDRVRQLAGDKPIGLIEINYSSKDHVHSRTETDQADFVDAVFDYLEAAPEAFEFANWYGLFDETPRVTRAWVTAQFGDMGEDFVESMIAQWANQGLLQRSGKPKPAWSRWLERSAALQARAAYVAEGQ